MCWRNVFSGVKKNAFRIQNIELKIATHILALSKWQHLSKLAQSFEMVYLKKKNRAHTSSIIKVMTSDFVQR